MIEFGKPKTIYGGRYGKIRTIQVFKDREPVGVMLQAHRASSDWDVADSLNGIVHTNVPLKTAKHLATLIVSGDTAALATIDRARDGLPIAQRPRATVRRPDIANKPHWFTGICQGAEAWSNGYFLAIGLPPVGDAVNRYPDGSFDRIIPTGELTELTVIGFSADPGGDVTLYATGSAGGVTWIAARYYDWFRREFGATTTFHQGDDPHAPIVVRRCGEFVGLLMPIRASKLPPGIAAIIAPEAVTA